MPRLHEQFGITTLSLFGSVARGDDRSDSDVDVLVDFAGGATLLSYFGLKRELEQLLGCHVDVATTGSMKRSLRLADEIAREGIRVA